MLIHHPGLNLPLHTLQVFRILKAIQRILRLQARQMDLCDNRHLHRHTAHARELLPRFRLIFHIINFQQTQQVVAQGQGTFVPLIIKNIGIRGVLPPPVQRQIGHQIEQSPPGLQSRDFHVVKRLFEISIVIKGNPLKCLHRFVQHLRQVFERGRRIEH
ncbi:hypothetical protein BB931_00020 [Spiribacter salinus]|nr:hypothetical protein [Spiribacter salinus]